MGMLETLMGKARGAMDGLGAQDEAKDDALAADGLKKGMSELASEAQASIAGATHEQMMSEMQSREAAKSREYEMG